MLGNETRFLLRVWSDGNEDEVWRATLRDLRTDDTWHFASIKQLIGHLAQLTEGDSIRDSLG